ncbi:MAG: guanylate kinase [Candidatus Eisenbacteria bacterium]|uniref:Guanylate kinase n=1 Tax=Eiseniibacteriota bacterium TaxID=2212470 RepID=A0A9D6L650_UNCEI|nr:guanylate kinase [Candidatus Eisenbacteria bacterium]
MTTRPAETMSRAIPFAFAPGGFLLVLSGPSGAGKGTLVDRLVAVRPECVFAISATTRPRRSIEQDGVQYEFVTREEFERRRGAGLFLEWAEVHGHLYATPAQFVDEGVRAGRIVVLDVDVQGGASVRRVRPDAVSVFIYPPSIEALRRRLLQRSTDLPEVVERRLQDAPGELMQYREYDYLVVNDDLEQAVARLVAIVDAERSRVRRLEAE